MPVIGDTKAFDRVWVSQDGRKIPYPVLEDIHLLNIILMLRRRSQNAAQDAAEKAGARLGPGGWRMRKHSRWDGLVAEALRRGGAVADAARAADSAAPVDEVALRSAVDPTGAGGSSGAPPAPV